MTQQIPLSQNKYALVDDDDFERVNRHKWHIHSNGTREYAARNHLTVRGWRQQLLHRFILGVDGEEIDHINRDGLDCRRANMRICNRAENACNRRKAQGKSSQYIGVSWYTRIGKWQAKVQVDGRVHHLGYFESELEAARAYNAEAQLRHGEFASLNEV